MIQTFIKRTFDQVAIMCLISIEAFVVKKVNVSVRSTLVKRGFTTKLPTLNGASNSETFLVSVLFTVIVSG